MVGRRLIPFLVERGHEVFGTTRSVENKDRLSRIGATPVVMDALDDGAVKEAVTIASPDVVVHELTPIPASVSIRRFDASFAETNRLRLEGTDHLLEAARSASARRFVAQSYAAWPYEQRVGPVKSEVDPLDDAPPASIVERSRRSATWSRSCSGTTSCPSTVKQESGAELARWAADVCRRFVAGASRRRARRLRGQGQAYRPQEVHRAQPPSGSRWNRDR